MDGDLLPWLFLVAGALLVGSELFYQSFLGLFLGLAALLVGGLAAVGIVEGLLPALALWGVLSAALAIPLRPIVRRFFPGRGSHDPTHEDDAAYGEVVDVLEPVTEGEVRGRIRFQGSTWPAMCTDGSIPAGAKARLLYRDKLTWVVEPLSQLEAAELVPKADEAKERK